MSNPVSGRPLPSSFDENDDFYNESGLQKVISRIKREPLIPLGCFLTVAAFLNAYRAMRKGDHHQVQRMFRARVYAQGFTILAAVGGGVYFGAERNKERELWKLKQEEETEEKRMRWIRELEARDAEEKELRAMMDKRRDKKKAADAREAFRAADAKSDEKKKEEEEAATAGPASGSSAWGLWKSGSKATHVQQDVKNAQEEHPEAKEPKAEPDSSSKR